jgi:hypothetical protein
MCGKTKSFTHTQCGEAVAGSDAAAPSGSAVRGGGAALTDPWSANMRAMAVTPRYATVLIVLVGVDRLKT